MITVYEVSRKHIMLFMHNNRYLSLSGLLTYFVLPEKNREIFLIFQKYFTKYFMKYFTSKLFMKFYIIDHICYVYVGLYLAYVYCTAPLSHGWGRLSKSR